MKLIIPPLVLGLMLLQGCKGASDSTEYLYGNTSSSSSSSSSSSGDTASKNTIDLQPFESAAGLFWSNAGMSLYTFDADDNFESKCGLGCTRDWPPLLVDAGTSLDYPFSTFVRSEGSTQVALRGRPLYTRSTDLLPGDITGENIAGVWHLAALTPIIIKANKLAFKALGRVFQGKLEGDKVVGEWVIQTGYTLYTFAKDSDGNSNCKNNCVNNWPPLLAHSNAVAANDFTLVAREDSSLKQWAYLGAPLYFYSGDTSSDSTLGKDLPNWSIAKANQFKWTEEGKLVSRGGAHTIQHADAMTNSLPNGFEIVARAVKNQFTLYAFSKDSEGISNCIATCLNNWPALFAPDDAEAFGPFSIIERGGTSNFRQWAYKSQPLYFFAKDTKALETKGDGLGGAWSVVTQ